MICSGCGIELTSNNYVTKWDEKGYGYSTKLRICPECGKVLEIVGYTFDRIDINNDKRYFEYNR